MLPWEQLAEAARTALAEGTNVYETPTASVVVPALVIRPDNPWREVGPTYCIDQQNYVAVAVVQAATPKDGTARIYRMHNALRNALPEGWSWKGTGAIIIDESTGAPFLAASMRLTYLNTNDEEEES